MVDFVEYTDDLVTQLNAEELMEFLYQYDKYIRNFFEDHDEGSEPVGMTEFFNNDYQVIINGEEE